jgi:hypothetical protein
MLRKEYILFTVQVTLHIAYTYRVCGRGHAPILGGTYATTAATSSKTFPRDRLAIVLCLHLHLHTSFVPDYVKVSSASFML